MIMVCYYSRALNLETFFYLFFLLNNKVKKASDNIGSVPSSNSANSIANTLKPTPTNTLRESKNTENAKNKLSSKENESKYMHKTSLGDANNEVHLEIKNILESLGYDENLGLEWLDKFMEDFSKTGIDALDEYESRFGQRDSVKLKKLIKANENLSKHFKHILPKEVTHEQALIELKNILCDMGYNQNMQWINVFLNEFLVSGFNAIENFVTKFGEKDTGILKRLASQNEKLNFYNANVLEKKEVIVKNSPSKEVSILIIGNIIFFYINFKKKRCKF